MSFNLFSYMKHLKDEYYQRWGIMDTKEQTGISKASSSDSLLTRLPTLEDATLTKRSRKSQKKDAKKKTSSRADFKTSLSSSMPDLTNKQLLPPLKYEKLSYSKCLHKELPPAPGATVHPRQPALPPIEVSHKADQEAFNIMNMLDRSVDYYEENGHLYINEKGDSRKWKSGCMCKQCHKKKAEWLETRKKDEEIKLKKIRNGLIMRDTDTTPVEEEENDEDDEPTSNT